MMMSWCLMSSDVIWHIRDKLWPMPKHGSIKATYVRCMRVLAVTCHLHFWQNDRDFLRATVVTRGWNGYRNKSQHRKSTLEKKILPPFQQGFEPATFQSRVRRSNHMLFLFWSGFCMAESCARRLSLFLACKPVPGLCACARTGRRCASVVAIRSLSLFTNWADRSSQISSLDSWCATRVNKTLDVVHGYALLVML